MGIARPLAEKLERPRGGGHGRHEQGHGVDVAGEAREREQQIQALGEGRELLRRADEVVQVHDLRCGETQASETARGSAPPARTLPPRREGRSEALYVIYLELLVAERLELFLALCVALVCRRNAFAERLG